MSKPQLKVYIDLVSPFAYIAFQILTKSKTIQDQVTLTFVPALLGGIMKECGNAPPLTIKNKDKWIMVERVRWAKSFNVPMAAETPPGFPQRTLDVQRHMAALSKIAPEKVPTAAEALWTHFFVDRGNLAKPEDFMPTLTKAIGEKLANEVASKAPTEGKAVLAANTQAALADGAFGMPWMVATNAKGETECFWGVDHLGQVIEHLGLRKPEAEEKGWRAML